MELFDTHCHLDVAEFDADREKVLARCRAQGVTRMLVPAIEAAGWPVLLQLCRRESGLYPALGLHPIYIARHRMEDIHALERLVAEQRPCAIGEIGLDFYVTGLDRERQQRLFEAQLTIARDADLPVVLHVRKAHDQVLATLRRFKLRGGTSHAFNGSLQQAQQYIDLGFKLGFGGMLTFERSSKLRRLARELPLESIVLETDAPDMTPAAHQGGRNSPEYLPEILAALAEVSGVPPETVARQTTDNALALFGLN